MKRSLVVFLFLASSFISARDFPIRVTSPRGGEFYLPGQRQAVVLDSGTRAKLVLVELSPDGGDSFEFLGTIDNTVRDRSKRNILVWTVPFTETRNAVIRVTSSDSRRPGAGLSNSFGIGQPALESSVQSFGYVIRSGDDMSGPLTLSRDPESDSEASNKRYVDVKHKDLSEKKVSKSGGVMTGDLVLNGTPYSPLQAATKEYVDSTASDSDTVDGKHADDFLDKASYASPEKGKVLLAEVADLSVESANSDTVDGKHATDLLDKNTYDPSNSGKVLWATDADSSMTSMQAVDSDMLDGKDSSEFLDKESYASEAPGKVLKAEVADLATSASFADFATSSSMLDDKRAEDFLDKATYDPLGKGKVLEAEVADFATSTNLLNGRPDSGFLRIGMDNTTSGSIVVTGLGRKMSVLSSIEEADDDYYGSVPKLEVKTPDGNDGFSVNQHGLVKSSSGYEFPDGTVQTTAATSTVIPPGYIIFGPNTTPPAGFSYSGTSVGPVREKWEEKKVLPSPRYDACSAVVDGIIYVMGGSGSPGAMVANEAYDPSSNTWVSKTPLPYENFNATAVSLGGFIYVMGGIKPEENVPGPTTSIIKYDPATDEWTDNLPPMVTPREKFVVEAVGGKIYAMGGSNESNNEAPLASVEIYDPDNNKWTSAPPLNTPTFGACSAVANGKIYVVGGQNLYAILSQVQEYDPTSGCTLKAEIPHGRADAGAVTLNGRIYVISGIRYGITDHKTYDNYEYDPVSDSWVSEQIEYVRRGTNMVWTNDSVRRTWRDETFRGPDCIQHATCSVAGGKIHLIGGRPSDSNDFNNHLVYSVSLLFAHEKD